MYKLGNTVTGYTYCDMAILAISVEKAVVQPLKPQQLKHIVGSCDICCLAEPQIADLWLHNQYDILEGCFYLQYVFLCLPALKMKDNLTIF